MRRLILLLSFLGLLLCCLGCGAALSPSFTPPEQGGPPWTELWTPHFVLRTDLPESEAREMIAEFERIYTTFEDIAFPFEIKPKGRISTLVFRDQYEYKQIAPRNTRGFYRPRGEDSDDFVPSVFLYGDLTNQTRLSFQHELTHRFVHFYYPNAPQWLNEGLAQYYSTITVEDGKAIVGKPLPHLLFQPGLTWAYEETPVWRQTFVATADVPHLGTLLGSGPSDFRAAAQRSDDEKEKREDSKRVTANYAGAWALVHVLRNGPDPYPDLFDKFLIALSAGESPESAWPGELTDRAEDIDRNLQAFFMRKTTKLLQTPYEPKTPVVRAVHTMAPQDVHLLWAAIRPWRTEADGNQIRADIQAALNLDPTSPRARLSAARLLARDGKLAEAERVLDGLVAEDPTNERSLLARFNFHYVLAKRATPKERGRHSKRAEELLPDLVKQASSSSALNAAAWYLAEHKRTEEGLPLALRSVKADFNCWECLDTLALLFSQSGAHDKALEAQTLALNLMPDGMSVPDVLDRWRQYQKAARDAAKEKKAKAKPTPSEGEPESSSP